MSLDVTIDEGSLAEIAALLGVPDADALADVRTEVLRQRTHRQLLEVSKRLGLSGVSRLTKDALAAKLGKTLPEVARAQSPRQGKEPVSNGKAPARADSEAPQPQADEPTAVLSHKFESGQHGTAREEPRTIPWSYSMDRVTAMPVDPERLFVYWEVTDDAIAQARAQLGNGGPGAWLNLRYYDVTDRLFDGTNAHSTFDHKIERHDRQWFFAVNKSSSQAVVDVGLLSHEGYFAKIARSGRVDFPRRGPVAWSDPEWMSVREGGRAAPAGRGLPGHQGGDAPGGGGGAGGGGGTAGFEPLPLWNMRAPWEQVLREGQTGHEERIEWEEFWSTGEGE